MTAKVLSSIDVIEVMTGVACDQNNSEAYRIRYREALRSLVRLARAEQMLEIQRDFNQLTQFCDTRSHF
jgi:hypothetical protein